eukprot:TRINITY_DN2662_c0_g1_i2.p1 TRINITY_DN2662_c0_g1~~TRINITY_DN2662_c0_g1_i2.p1  ORF type:complete len:93 (-),score=14.18 TRINITY_DN2662_c0_g1_i2:87-365(-)
MLKFVCFAFLFVGLLADSKFDTQEAIRKFQAQARTCLECSERVEYFCHRQQACKDTGNDKNFCTYWVGCKGELKCGDEPATTYRCSVEEANN